MIILDWLRQWWFVPLLGALLAAGVAVLNIAVVRDRYIREAPVTAAGRNVIIGGHLLIALALGTLPFGLYWDRVALFVALMLTGVGLFQFGSALILFDRITARWNTPPWNGTERRHWQRRQKHVIWRDRERRKGERRASVTRPGDLDSRPHYPDIHYPTTPSKFDHRPQPPKPSDERRERERRVWHLTWHEPERRTGRDRRGP